MNLPAPAAPDDDRSDITSRFIPAPPARVFAAIADPMQLMRWWGPEGFSSTFDVFQPRAGGAWRFTMHGPQGSTHPNESVFTEFGPAQVVVRHLNGHRFDLTLQLQPEAGGTRLHWRQQFDERAEYERLAGFVRQANEQNLDRLAAVIAADPAGHLAPGPDGKRVVEVRTYRLKPGTIEAFHRVVRDDAVPMLRDWQTDVVAHGPSPLNESGDPAEADGYTLLRSYKDAADRQARQDAFYGAPGWRQGPRERVIGAIDTYISSLLWLSPAAIDELRAPAPATSSAPAA